MAALAISTTPALSQTPPVPRDTVRPPVATDSTVAPDSLADTLQTPYARAEAPGIETVYRWGREAIFQSNAQTIAELLEIVPGVTSYRTAFLASPAVVAYLGDIARLRVFYDGLELVPLDPRTGEVFDLVEVPLWSAEEVRLERAAGELRLHIRSWRVSTRTPVTRTDVFTGDEDANLYRGFFGRRFRNGLGFQVGAQQYSTSSRRNLGGGDELALLARVGWARGAWSVDGFVNRTRRNREVQQRTRDASSRIPALEATRTDAYLRAGYGDPDHGPWAQLIAGSMGFKETTPGTGAPAPTDPDVPVPSPDTVRSRAQYVATGGFSYRGLRLSAANRFHVFEGERFNAQSARLVLDRTRLGLSLFAERSPSDSVSRADVVGRFALTNYLWIGGSAGQRWDDPDRSEARDVRAMRAEAGVRLARLNVSGGVLARDSAVIAPATLLDSSYAARGDAAITGPFIAVRGALWRDINVEAQGVMWGDDAGPYRPRYQSRVQLYLATRWLRRFPSGNFGLILSGTHDYKSPTCFPTSDGGCERTTDARIISTLVEIRILRAVLSWQFQNVQLAQYDRVPGFEMPRGVNFYGVRWEFLN